MRKNLLSRLTYQALLVLGSIAFSSAACAYERWVNRSTIIEPNNCAIRARIPVNAVLGNGFRIENPHRLRTKNYIEPLAFNFECRPSDDEVVNSGWAKYEAKEGW
ncbi:hypothetical protein [Variovorax sp. GT1P44]|uniref:hypothetical protein n=1 Tax=Variovorax sp. GT1P44 TaxID=3443742 RepID=UPI003F490528